MFSCSSSYAPQVSQLIVKWELNSTSITQLDHYEREHGNNALHRFLDRFIQPNEPMQNFVDLIPREPVPAKALVTLLFNLCKLAQARYNVEMRIFDLARNIFGFVDKVLLVYRKGRGRGVKFTREMWKKITVIKHVIDKIAIWVFKELEKGKIRRIFGSAKMQHTLSNLCTEFDEALRRFDALADIEGARTGNAILEAPQSQEDADFLRGILPTQLTLGQHRPCLPLTRATALKEIMEWAGDLSISSRTLFWLSGTTGSGKSTIATTISQKLRKHIVCEFFFGLTESTDIFKSFAYQLSQISASASAEICKALRSDHLLCNRFARDQFRKLFLQPLQIISKAKPYSSFLVLVDALDEALPSVRAEILLWIADAMTWNQFPSNVKLFVTSQPEGDLIAAFSQMKSIQRHHLNLDSEELNADIQTCFKSRMVQTITDYNLRGSHPKLDLDWPGRDRVDQLCEQASGSFIWIATAASFISNHLRRRGLQRIGSIFDHLSGGGHGDVDALYQTILIAAYGGNRWTNSDFAAFRRVLGVLTTLRRPQTLGMLQDLLVIEKGFDLSLFVSRLQPLLVINSNETPTSVTIPLIHPSFVDFITDSRRCTDRRFQVSKTNAQMYTAECILAQLGSLRYNICQIPRFGSRFNTDIVDLRGRFTKHVPDALYFACCYWTTYLSDITFDRDKWDDFQSTNVYKYLTDFFAYHFLHWIELMSLSVSLKQRKKEDLQKHGHGHSGKEQVAAASRRAVLGDMLVGLETVGVWVEKFFSSDPRFSTLVTSVRKLVEDFNEPIMTSAAHVYISALPFTSPSSFIYQQYESSNSFAVKVTTRTSGSFLANNSGDDSTDFIMKNGWIQRASNRRLICWIPREYQGDWKVRNGMVMMNETEAVIDVRDVLEQF